MLSLILVDHVTCGGAPIGALRLDQPTKYSKYIQKRNMECISYYYY